MRPRRTARRVGRVAALLLTALPWACGAGEEAGPRWVRLASAAGAAPYAEATRGTWFTLELRPSDFTPGLVDGFWFTEDPFADAALPVDSAEPPVMEAGGRALAFRDRVGINADLKDILGNPPDEGMFFFFNQKLHVSFPPPAELPERLELRAFVNVSALSGESARTRTAETVADGFSILPDAPLELRADLPPGSALTFSLAALAPFEDRAEAGEARLTIELDGEPVFSVGVTPGRRSKAVPHRVALPDRAHAGARWRFEATGAQAVWTLRNPVVGPAAIGAPRSRPWEGQRPNLVVFLADTLRADALGVYGGEEDVTPNLDAFAAGAATFLRAWAPSSWTLPSHASLFSGVFPYQHGARLKGRSFGTGLETLGERLAAEGYRTGAVTDGLFVSRRWGMDRGFEWFRENDPGRLEDTLAGVREFLAADDGRPFLLFVQSYHAHGPYLLEEETLAEHGERLGITETWQDLMARVTDVLRREGVLNQDGPGLDVDALFSLLQRSDVDETLHEMTDQFHAIYLARVLELDRMFGELLGELEDRGLREGSYLVFTSDHGEAFGEHGKLFHGSGVWDEVLRIPLIVSGPGVEPGERPFGASLVDIAPTLADAAGVPPAATWLGTSLLDLDRDRPVFSFDCPHHGEPLALWVDGDFKVAVPAEAPEGEPPVRYLYDLGADPGERANLSAAPPEGALAGFDELAGTLELLLEPLDAGGDAALDAETLERLQAMGYADEGED